MVYFVEPANLNIGSSQCIIQNDAISAFAAHANETVVLKFFPGDFSPSSQRIIAPAHQHERILQKRCYREVRIVAPRILMPNSTSPRAILSKPSLEDRSKIRKLTLGNCWLKSSITRGRK